MTIFNGELVYFVVDNKTDMAYWYINAPYDLPYSLNTLNAKNCPLITDIFIS